MVAIEFNRMKGGPLLTRAPYRFHDRLDKTLSIGFLSYIYILEICMHEQ